MLAVRESAVYEQNFMIKYMDCYNGLWHVNIFALHMHAFYVAMNDLKLLLKKGGYNYYIVNSTK